MAAAAGPQAPNVFERASGQPLTAGIPALFTRDGYRQAFRPAMDKHRASQLAEEESLGAWAPHPDHAQSPSG